MTLANRFIQKLNANQNNVKYRSFWQYLHMDIPLLISIFLVLGLGLIILYSASTKNIGAIERQLLRIGLSCIIMFVFAQIPPIIYQRWAIWLYITGVLLLSAVLIFGHIGKGAERWLNLGIVRFQPSEMMKLAIPMFLAWYCHKTHLPLTIKSIVFALVIIMIPALLTAKQPDLGTAILLVIAGGSVLLLAGIRWRLIGTMLSLITLSAPVIWYFMMITKDVGPTF